MKIAITIYVHFFRYDLENEGSYQVLSYRAQDDGERSFVCSQEVEIDIPDNYDATAQKVAALEAKKEQAMAEYIIAVAQIEQRIAQLQPPPAVDVPAP